MDATITPTIAGGKGFGHFDVQSTFGATLPTAETNLIGRTLAWNTAFQYKVGRMFWPGGSEPIVLPRRAGKWKEANLPHARRWGGMHLWHRLALTVGGGFQIAIREYHKHNNNGILTVRFPF
jgi:hypothetical protein